MIFLKRYVPLAIAFGVGIVMLITYYIPHSSSQTALTEFSMWTVLISGFALAIGLSSLLHMHVGKIWKKVPGWGFSLVTVVALVVTAAVGIITGGKDSDQMMWIYLSVYTPLGATMFSILAFFIASAAYRAFRARTVEATILLIAAIIIMLQVLPLGFLAAIRVPQTKDWILNWPSMAAQRGIMIGVALSIVATSLRIIFGIERTYLGGGD
jgi:hypothetical protein